jgi:hypothetical protein
MVTNDVREQGRRAYGRQLCLAQCVEYVHHYLLAKIWYVAQVFPIPKVQAQQLTTIVSWYLWQGATLRFPVTTMRRPKSDGEWGIIDVECKCLGLLYNRMALLEDQGER